MKRNFLLTLLFFSALLIGSTARAAKVSIKFSAGQGFFNLQKINRYLNDWFEGEKAFIDLNPNWTYLDGNIAELHSGFELSGEIQIAINPRLTVGFGAGFIYSELVEGKNNITFETNEEDVWTESTPVKVTAIPISISGYYYIPLSPSFRFYVMGGAGPVWGKYISREAWQKSTEGDPLYFGKLLASGSGSHVFAGGGFEFALDEGLQVFLEASGQMCQASNFQGENEFEETGVLYYVEEMNQNTELWLVKNLLETTEPRGKNLRSVQKATVDLSGFNIKIGLVIQF